LIQQIATDEFRPESYRDDVRERVLELIQKKVEGEDITQAPEEAPPAQIIDLMEALKASLARTTSTAADASTRGRKAAKRATSPGKKAAPKKRAAGGAKS